MSKERNRVPFENFGQDVKEAREILKLSRKSFAETIGISPRYLANIEISGALPSLPIFYEIINICKLPVTQYFFIEPEKQESQERERVKLKLSICPEQYLPIVEATIDGAIKLDEAERG